MRFLYLEIRRAGLHASAYVSIRQHTSAYGMRFLYLEIRRAGLHALEEVRVVAPFAQLHDDIEEPGLVTVSAADEADVLLQNRRIQCALHAGNTSAYVSIRLHTSACISLLFLQNRRIQCALHARNTSAYKNGPALP